MGEEFVDSSRTEGMREGNRCMKVSNNKKFLNF